MIESGWTDGLMDWMELDECEVREEKGSEGTRKQGLEGQPYGERIWWMENR